MRQFTLEGRSVTINKNYFYCPLQPREKEVFCGVECMWFKTNKIQDGIVEVFCKDSFMGVLANTKTDE